MNYLMDNKLLRKTVVWTIINSELDKYSQMIKSSYMDYDGDKLIKDTIGLQRNEYKSYYFTNNKKGTRKILNIIDSNGNIRKKNFKKAYIEEYTFQREFIGWAFDLKEIYSQKDTEKIKRIVEIIEESQDYAIDYYDEYHIINGNLVKQLIVEVEGCLPDILKNEDFKDIALLIA